MKLRDIKIGWRVLLADPSYSAIVIVGLAVGVAVCFLLLGFVRYSTSYDEHVPDGERVYLVKTRFNHTGALGLWKQKSSLKLKEVLDGSGLNIQSTSYVLPLTVSALADQVPQQLQLNLVHPSFEQVFGLVALKGNLKESLSRPDSLVLTVDTAQRLFGHEEALGKSVRIAGQTLTVGAIIADVPSSTTFPYTALAGTNSVAITQEARESLFDRWNRLTGVVFIRLGQGVTPDTVEKLLQDAVDRSPLKDGFAPELLSQLGSLKLMEVRVTPLQGAYLDPEVSPDMLILHGDLGALRGLSAVALLILLLATTNYVNLATVRTLQRQREIAMRKVLGARVARVVTQFFVESLLVALIATGLGLILAAFCAPVFSRLINRHLDHLFSPSSLLLALAGAMLLGLLSGLYPAWVALRVRATQALSGRGNSETKSGLWIRRVLTVAQFSIAMGLCAVSVAIAWQTSFASKLDPGFDPDPLLVVDLPAGLASPNSMAFRDALARLPSVAAVTGSWDAIGRKRGLSSQQVQRQGSAPAALEKKGVRQDFFEAHQIRPVVGRLFDRTIDADDSRSVVLNRAAASALGFPSADAAIGQFVEVKGDDKPSQIIGIAPDIRFQSLRNAQQPLVYAIVLDTKTLTVRARGDTDQVQADIEQLWKRYFPNDVFSATTSKAVFEELHGDDARMASLLAISTVITIIIAAFGIYVFAAYTIERRSKEIVLRKLYGAGPAAIARIVGKEFLAIVLVSAVLGLPVAAVMIERFLAPFLERAPMGWLPLLCALLAAAAVAMISSLRHTMRAVRLSPRQALA